MRKSAKYPELWFQYGVAFSLFACSVLFEHPRFPDNLAAAVAGAIWMNAERKRTEP